MLRGVQETNQLPIGTTADERAAGVAVADTAGAITTPAMPNRSEPAVEPVRIERTETPLVPDVGGYDSRFSQPVRVQLSPNASITPVPPPSGLQPGENGAGIPSVPIP